MPQRETAGRGCNGDRSDHRRQQRDKREESLGAVDRALHLGAATFKRLDALTALQALLQRLRIRSHGRALACDQQAIRHAAAVGDQLSGGKILDVQHHARRKVDELRTAIGLDRNDLADAKCFLAQLQRITRRSPNRQQQLAIDPYFAARGNLACHLVVLPDRIGDAQIAA